jgi:hypothetical protein
MSQRHNTICPETRVNDSPLLNNLKLVSGPAQRLAIGRAAGGLVGNMECGTNPAAGITRTATPTGRFFHPGIELTLARAAWWG